MILGRALFAIVLILFSSANDSFARSSVDLPGFTANDRVLILAPHPDDETIGAGGVIQKALSAGAKVKIVLLTNGENNLLSFMVYDKRFFFGPKRMIRMGAVRREETVKALKLFGVAENDVISLGYPDSGTFDIIMKRWGKAKPLSGGFTHAAHVPYSDALSSGAPYLGQSILKDLEFVLSGYRPTKIFMSHPADLNRDHQALYLFMRVALWDLERKITAPEIEPYLIHSTGWPVTKGYKPALKLDPPSILAGSEISWKTLGLSPAEVAKKSGAIKEYQSQIKYAPGFLISFARKNELFGDYPTVKISRQGSSEPSFHSLSYARENNVLLVRVSLRRWINKYFGVSLSLLPYNQNVIFSGMPKVMIKANLWGLHARDQTRGGALKGIEYKAHGKYLEFRIPLPLLGDPDSILINLQTALKDLTRDEMAWRVLSLDSATRVLFKVDTKARI